MGRTIVADERVERHIHTFFGSSKWLIGLVIGQFTAQRDYAIHVIRTPEPDPGDVAVDEVEDQSTPATKMEKATSLDVMDEHWVATHAKQVDRMLTGGLSVIGVFAMAPPDMMKAAQAKLRQVVFAVHKNLSKGAGTIIPSGEEDITDRVLLQICSLSKKITCKTFDVADPKCAPRPADWKYQSFASSWSCLETRIHLDINFPVSKKNISNTLMKQIQSGILPVCQNIWNAMSTVNGQILPGDSLLDTSQQGKKRKGKNEENSSPRQYSVQLFSQTQRTPVADPVIIDCGAKMMLRGAIQCRAFLHSKATVAEGLKALKTDVIRSLLSRCELMYEEIMQTEEDQDPKVLYETPRRVFGQVPDTTVCLSDYIFPDETAKDCLQRFKELADIRLTEEDLQLDSENLPDESDLKKPEYTLPPDPNSVQQQKQESGKQSINVMGAVVGGAVALIAAGISYMFLGDTAGQ